MGRPKKRAETIRVVEEEVAEGSGKGKERESPGPDNSVEAQIASFKDTIAALSAQMAAMKQAF